MAGRLLDIPSDVPGKEIASAWAWPTAKSPTRTPVGSPSGSQSRSGNPQPTCSDKTILVGQWAPLRRRCAGMGLSGLTRRFTLAFVLFMIGPLGPVELSLTVTVGREAAPGAKIRFWVIEAGADAKVSREAVQEIKLVLSPRNMKAPLGPDGKSPAPLIEGKPLPGVR
jgi:Trypsin-co-occurring domain 2